MHEAPSLVLAALAGLSFGLVFFGGLWWTVRKCMASPRPALWFFGSSMLRTGFVLAGFYGVGGEHWGRLLLCLLGFVIARFALTRLLPASAETETGQLQVAKNAS